MLAGMYNLSMRADMRKNRYFQYSVQKNVFFTSHKQVVYDDNHFQLLDVDVSELNLDGEPLIPEGMIHQKQGKLFPGKDYRNTFLKEDKDMHIWDEDALDRTLQTRCPWQDIASVVYGKPAWDVARHFIQRWNFQKMQTAKSDEADPNASIRYILPAPLSVVEERLSDELFEVPEEEDDDEVRAIPELEHLEVQPLRSVGHWSIGIQSNEKSIQNTYIRLIQNSERFVYIENQFFVSSLMVQSTQKNDVANNLGQAIAKL